MAMEEIDSGIKCLFAQDGPHALEKLGDMAELPDVMFIDINMPRMNGIILLSELKKIGFV